MNSNDKKLQKVKNNIFSNFFNKIKIFFFKKQNETLSKDKVKVLDELKNEYENLLKERDLKKEELQKIINKDLEITLKIYELEEKELIEIKELALDELADLKNEYQSIKKPV